MIGKILPAYRYIVWVGILLLLSPTAANALDKTCDKQENFSLAIHGGAVWGVAPHVVKEAFIKQQLRAARQRLTNGDKALDIIEEIITDLENSGLFNAGKGSVANQASEIEMDASLMEGKHLRAGSVASIRKLKNPIKAARFVMDNTPNVMMVGPAADGFLTKNGVTSVEQSYFLHSGIDFPDLALPSDIKIVEADKSVPAERARFLGVWGGVLAGRLNHILIVRKLGNEGADVTVLLGANERLGIGEAVTLQIRAKFFNQYLIVQTPRYRIAYEFTRENALVTRFSATEGGRITGVMKSRAGYGLRFGARQRGG